MELLDIVDEKGNPTGETVEREYAHQNGIRHRTAHVWLVREHNNKLEILLQKRSHNKDSHPDCFDISSAGHIPAGIDFIPSAIRELKEELGIDVEPEELIYLGLKSFYHEGNYHNKIFKDNQVTRVYMIWKDLDVSEFTLQEEEVSEVRWYDFDECYKCVENNLFKHCIYLSELDLIREQVK